MTKHIVTGLIFLLTAAQGHAADLRDVKVLSVEPTDKESIKLKLQAPGGPKNSHFFVDVVKTDPEAFQKIYLVTKKLKAKGGAKLNLTIESFSHTPSGSYYRSESVKFSAE